LKRNFNGGEDTQIIPFSNIMGSKQGATSLQALFGLPAAAAAAYIRVRARARARTHTHTHKVQRPELPPPASSSITPH